MSAISFSPAESRLHPTLSSPYSFSHMSPEASMDRRTSGMAESVSGLPTILLRKLPRNTTAEAVRTMLLFAKDLKDTEIVANEYDEDVGFVTAIARFSSMMGAAEAQAMLDGKPNTAGQANMIVEVVSGSSLGPAVRRNTMDPLASRKAAQSVSPPLPTTQKSSRFNGTFQTMEKISPPLMGSPPEHSSSSSSAAETASHLQTLFSPQSPIANAIQDRSRVSGKKVIDEDGGDDETGELLKDPLAYMNSSTSNSTRSAPHASRVLTAAFSALSLNTNLASSSPASYVSPRSAAVPSRTPHSTFSPTMGPNAGYSVGGQHHLRHNYPPVNPADQNPPCNTLYVGNLPIDTSEDELKAMFSKQRGYKRLCFRTKQNGPMCFVEFEDVSFATKALNELYGAQLHNSVKGGIRLSFSKNPLGVRAGQPGSSTNPTTTMSPSGPITLAGFSNIAPGAFSTANGPPPGLSVPPGLNMSMAGLNGPVSAPTVNGPFVGQNLGMGGPAMHGVRGMQINSASSGPGMTGLYPDYMMGR